MTIQDTARESGYNGWSNYETWAVALWLDNEEGSYNYVRERAAEALKDAQADPVDYLTPVQDATNVLADALKGEHEDGAEMWHNDGPASVFSDLLSAAMGRVDWHEVARSLVSEVVEVSA